MRELIGKHSGPVTRHGDFWIPAFAGMTVLFTISFTHQ